MNLCAIICRSNDPLDTANVAGEVSSADATFTAAVFVAAGACSTLGAASTLVLFESTNLCVIICRLVTVLDVAVTDVVEAAATAPTAAEAPAVGAATALFTGTGTCTCITRVGK